MVRNKSCEDQLKELGLVYLGEEMNQEDMMSALRTLKGCHSIEGVDMFYVSLRKRARALGWKPQGSVFSSTQGRTS